MSGPGHSVLSSHPVQAEQQAGAGASIYRVTSLGDDSLKLVIITVPRTADFSRNGSGYTRQCRDTEHNIAPCTRGQAWPRMEKSGYFVFSQRIPYVLEWIGQISTEYRQTTNV